MADMQNSTTMRALAEGEYHMLADSMRFANVRKDSLRKETIANAARISALAAKLSDIIDFLGYEPKADEPLPDLKPSGLSQGTNAAQLGALHDH